MLKLSVRGGVHWAVKRSTRTLGKAKSLFSTDKTYSPDAILRLQNVMSVVRIGRSCLPTA